MSAVLDHPDLYDPLISEFESESAAEAYDQWFRAKVMAAMNSTEPLIPHDEAMRLVQERLQKKREARAYAAVD